MENDKLYPVDFAVTHPFGSVFRNMECEGLACRILHHMTDWNHIPTWEEYYETLHVRDKGVSWSVQRDFDKVLPYLSSPEKCAEFAPAWKELLDKFNSKK